MQRWLLAASDSCHKHNIVTKVVHKCRLGQVLGAGPTHLASGVSTKPFLPGAGRPSLGGMASQQALAALTRWENG
jgi:hypothetical protein